MYKYKSANPPTYPATNPNKDGGVALAWSLLSLVLNFVKSTTSVVSFFGMNIDFGNVYVLKGAVCAIAINQGWIAYTNTIMFAFPTSGYAARSYLFRPLIARFHNERKYTPKGVKRIARIFYRFMMIPSATRLWVLLVLYAIGVASGLDDLLAMLWYFVRTAFGWP